MDTIQENYLKRLNEKLGELLNQNRPTTETAINKVVAKIKQAEYENKITGLSQKLKRINKDQKERRHILSRLLSFNLPSVDITNNDGSFHSVKCKKVTGLNEFLKDYPYTRAEFKDGLYLSFSVKGNNYRIKQAFYEYGKETAYSNFKTFNEVCRFNGIRVKPDTLKTVISHCKCLQVESEKLKIIVEKYQDDVKSLDAYFLENNGFIYAYNLHSLNQYKF